MRVYYFGCISSVGHYLFQADGYHARGVQIPDTDLHIEHIDGMFTPANDAQGSAKLTEHEGWTILAWHDYTVDSRPGSNSALIVEGRFTFEQMLDLLHDHFPSVFKRQPEPIMVQPL